jgi:hypothetical protein
MKLFLFIPLWTIIGLFIVGTYYIDLYPERLRFSCNCIVRLLLGGPIIWIISILILCYYLIGCSSTLLDRIFKPALDEEKK